VTDRSRAGSPLVCVAVLGAILAAVAILYAPVLGYPFLALDDQYGVATNPGIRDLSWRGIRFLFLHDQRDWRWFPFAYLSFAVDYAWNGLAPGAVHRTNLLLHLANTALVFALVRSLTRDLVAAAATSLLFGIHPLQVESVAWVSSRKTLLFTTFFLLAVLAYIRFARAAAQSPARGFAWLGASAALFFCSITAKPTAITLPAVLFLVDAVLAPALPRRPLAFLWRELPSKLVYLPAIAFTLWMTKRLSRPSPFGADFDFGALDWIAIVLHNVFFYVAKTLVPTGLGVFYPLPNGGAPLPLVYWGFALLGVAAIGVCIASWLRGARWLFFGTAWYLVTLLPNAVQPALFHDPPLVAADRYFYQSSIGLFLLAGVAFSTLWQRRTPVLRAGAALAAVAIAAALGAAARGHVRVFRDTIPLYEQTVAHHPSAAFYDRLAIEYADADRMASAFQALDLAAGAPSQVSFGDLCGFQMRLSDLHRRKGDFARAAALLARAIDATPNAIESASAKTPLAYRYLASLWDQAGDRAKAGAARAAAETARVDPSHYFESNWLVMAPDAALQFLEQRVREAPRDAVAWYYLGRGLQLDHQPARAIECLTRAKELGFPP
jgi:tetratricopeptide (TPR) repeat protein